MLFWTHRFLLYFMNILLLSLFIVPDLSNGSPFNCLLSYDITPSFFDIYFDFDILLLPYFQACFVFPVSLIISLWSLGTFEWEMIFRNQDIGTWIFFCVTFYFFYLITLSTDIMIYMMLIIQYLLIFALCCREHDQFISASCVPENILYIPVTVQGSINIY